ncbi:MAG TPA: hypothetical protein VET90_01775, partial [Candidatus Binatus sp.]|nr:hypothetical protein [Candidatus Binatus sp.]
MTHDRCTSLARHLGPVARLLGVSAAVGTLVLAFTAVALADSPAPAASGGPAISIVGTTFQPADLTIQAGQTVTWTVTQAVGAAHSVTSG